jgi:hypothetical protein
MTTLGGKLYVANNLAILEVDKKGNAKKVPVKAAGDWSRTTKMTVLDGNIYCINEEILWKLEPNGKVTQLTKEWYSVPGMAALDGKLYIISSEELYEVSPATGDYKSIGKDWYNVDGMVELGGKLYIVSRDTLYEVDKSGERKELEGTWNDPAGVTVADGKLYIMHFERRDNSKGGAIHEPALYEVDTSGKGTRLTLPKGFDMTTSVEDMAALDGKLYLAQPGMSKVTVFALDLK